MAVTKQAALSAGNTLDAAADLITANAAAFGIKPDVAKKFAYQCDLLGDHIAKSAGIDLVKMAAERKQALTGDDVHNEGAHGEDPEIIGEEVSGPKEMDADEPYMKGEFTQQENRELREKQQGGELGNDKTSPEPQAPRPGIQAALVVGKKMASLYMGFNEAAMKCAGSDDKAIQGLGTKLASAGVHILGFQTRVMEGSESDDRVANIERAAGHILPHFESDVSAAAAEKLARMTDILVGMATPAV